MSDLLTRVIVSRLSQLREIAAVIKSVIAEDARGYVTFGAMADAIAPLLYRTPSPALHRDIRQACRMMGLATTKAHDNARVIRGVRLR